MHELGPGWQKAPTRAGCTLRCRQELWSLSLPGTALQNLAVSCVIRVSCDICKDSFLIPEFNAEEVALGWGSSMAQHRGRWPEEPAMRLEGRG